MGAIMRYVLWLTIAVLLSSGCARDSARVLGGLVVDKADENQIVISYSALSEATGANDEINAKADEHCAKYGKKSMLMSKDKAGAETLLVGMGFSNLTSIYNCVD